MRRIGSVIEISVEALTKRKRKKNVRQKPEMVSKELDAQPRAANSTRASRQSVRTLRGMKEREARVIVRDERLVKRLLARQLNPIEDGNASRMTTTFSTLHSWRQRVAHVLKIKMKLKIHRKSRWNPGRIQDLQA